MNDHFHILIKNTPKASKLHQVERLHQSKVLIVKSFEMHVRSSKGNPEAYIDRILWKNYQFKCYKIGKEECSFSHGIWSSLYMVSNLTALRPCHYIDLLLNISESKAQP